MSEFKVGDRVIAKSEMAITESGGRKGTYLGYDDSNQQVIVQWDGKSSNLRYNETSVEVIVVNNDYDKAIEDMEAKLEELKLAREAEKLPILPGFYRFANGSTWHLDVHGQWRHWYGSGRFDIPGVMRTNEEMREYVKSTGPLVRQKLVDA